MPKPDQSQHPPHTPDSAKAALGNATLLQSFLLPAHSAESKAAMQAKNTPQTQESTPQQKPKASEGAKIELDLTEKLDAIRKEIKDDMQRDMDGIKQMIQQALTEEDAKEQATKSA